MVIKIKVKVNPESNYKYFDLYLEAGGEPSTECILVYKLLSSCCRSSVLIVQILQKMKTHVIVFAEFNILSS